MDEQGLRDDDSHRFAPCLSVKYQRGTKQPDVPSAALLDFCYVQLQEAVEPCYELLSVKDKGRRKTSALPIASINSVVQSEPFAVHHLLARAELQLSAHPAYEVESIRPSTAKLAPPFRFFQRSYPPHRRGLVRYRFPRSLRDRYRERLLDFHLDTLPYYKHRLQSRIYRYILERQRRRREQSRLIDYARRLLLGPPAARRTNHGIPTPARKFQFMTSMSSLDSSFTAGTYGANGGREKGARRRKLAAMAGSVYRAGAVAVNEIKESYNQTRSSEIDTTEISKITIPGSFPDVSIITHGNEQMVLFPSYAKWHTKGQSAQFPRPDDGVPPSSAGMSEQAYWHQEWARHEDEKAIVDVDVRGWIYNPHMGPMTRRNRVLIGLARQLSGIPAPSTQRVDSMPNAAPSSYSQSEQREEERERQSIALEAQEIERKGRAEEEAAQLGDYSERPGDEYSEEEGQRRGHRSRSTTPQVRSASPAPPAPPAPPSFAPPTRTNTAGGSPLSEAELAVANANLMARIGPFMTVPLVDIPITLFFYNDTQSQSRTVVTDDSGHFVMRAALDFIPTNVRVLANEGLSCTETIQITESRGVSLISDIDDTVKRSNIALGAKEIFRNTFVRDLKDLTVDGVRDWYTSLHNMGVSIHYCSNSPWQLYPVLATFFKLAGLPSGSLHLKRYSGMLQGIFEPVAERKKGTLEKIMHDFPERRFLLVGDSGEADLEVYTELAVLNPGRIKAIFIRDVTTPERPGFFDSAYDTGEGRNNSRVNTNYQDQKSRAAPIDDPRCRPTLPPRTTVGSKYEGPAVDDLIDLSDTPAPIHRTESGSTEPKSDAYVASTSGRRPPPKPAKPSALQSASAMPPVSAKDSNSIRPNLSPAPPLPRRSFPGSEPSTQSLPVHPLSRIHNASEQRLDASSSTSSSSTRSIKSSDYLANGLLPPPPPPRRRGTPSSTNASSPRPMYKRRTGDSSDIDFDSLPGTGTPGNGTPPSGSVSPSQAPPNKKLELWRRRLERAQDTLGQRGVPLYIWRRGEDVIAEAKAVVREALRGSGTPGDSRS
ncbi:hypothetical protein F4861DRAFT_540911 [Xylaria intraflava]|nr:hypothetical protein F4861DRAFT_540911 [Xylaria intraflava]